MTVLRSKTARMTMTVDSETGEVLARLQKFTGLSPAQTIQKIFFTHVWELHAYLAYLEQLPNEGRGTFAPFLLHNYGSGTLIKEIAQIDPEYAKKIGGKSEL